MRSLLIIAVIVVVGLLLVEGAPTERRKQYHRSRNPIGNAMHYFRKHQRAVARDEVRQRERRQSDCPVADCQTATNELDSDTFVICETTFNHELDGTGINDTEATNFCKINCDTTMSKVFNDIEACCGDQGFPQGFGEMMEDSCKTNSIGEKCVKEYQYAVELLTNPSSERGMEFINCVSSYQADTTQCPSNCATTLSYITDTIGCCFADVADSFKNGPGSLLSGNLFTTCGKTLPTRCP